jgi:hypothetical protein
MSDVEKLKEAIAVVDWLANGPATTNQQFSMNRDQALNVLLSAARSTLPKMKTVEVEHWGIINQRGDIVDTRLHKEAAAHAAVMRSKTSYFGDLYTVIRLTGTAEIPA